MPTIKVCLAELCNNSGMTPGEKSETLSSLAQWFGQICQGTNFTSMVSWVNTTPALTNTDLLCYFLPNNLNSLLSMAGAPDIKESHGKTHITPNGTISEIYVGQCRPSRHSHFIPQLAFHELMHNKLGLSDNRLHVKDGLARIVRDRNGVVHTNITPGRSPSQENLSDMRNALGVSRPQWIGGWAVNCRTFTDPLAGTDLSHLGG